MPSMTLLEITQDILSDMNSDSVNSINDTVEALQVAQIIKSTYFSIIDGRDWPHLFQFFKLTASGTASRPTHMSLPDNVLKVNWIKYNIRTSTDTKDKYTKIIYKTPEEFMEICDSRDSSASRVTQVTDPTGVYINIYNDTAPIYYTSFDNENIVMDAYDSGVDSTLTQVKSQCYGKVYPTWTMTDEFVADLPEEAFSYFLNEAKSACFLRIKEAPDAKSEQYSVSQRRRMSQDAWRVKRGITYPNYGRK